MKVLLGATAAAALLLATPALAQSQQANLGACQGFAAAPTLPDGASANSRAMTQAREAITEWRAGVEAQLAQCRAEIEPLRAQLNAMERAHNEADQARVATVNSFAAELEEFNARGNTGSNSRRGGVITRADP